MTDGVRKQEDWTKKIWQLSSINIRLFVEAVALEPKKLLVDAGKEKAKVKGRDFLVSEGFEIVSVRIDTLTIPRNSGTIHCLTMPVIRDSGTI